MMMTVPVSGLLRSADVDVSDLTPADRVGTARWVDESTLEIPFDPEPSPNEQTAIRRRLLTGDAEHEKQVVDLLAARASVRGEGPNAAALRLVIGTLLGPFVDDEPEA